MFKKIISFVLFLSVTFCYSTNTHAAYNSLYYIDKINVVGAKQSIKNIKLQSSYIVVLDSGINRTYFNNWKGKLNYLEPAKLSTMKSPWDGFGHGSEVTYVMDKIIYDLRTNNLNKTTDNQPIMTIPYKIVKDNGDSDLENLTAAINHVVDFYVIKKKLNIAAINFSSGAPASETSTTEKDNLQRAINRATSYGITFVTTSGNDNKRIFEYPALLKNVVTVGATNIANTRWVEDDGTQGSCYGKNLTLVAPGLDVKINEKGDYYTGTSYSAPMVSTAIALVKAINPKLKSTEVVSILKNTCTDLGKHERDDYYGNGLLNIKKAADYAIKTNAMKIQSVSKASTKLVVDNSKNIHTLSIITKISIVYGYIGRCYLNLMKLFKA